MRALFWLLALFAIAVAVSLGARMNEGYVLLVIPPWRMEVSFNLFIVGWVVAFSLFYLVLRGISLTFSLPRRVREYRSRQAQERAAAVFQDAVRLLFEGRFGQALKKAQEAYFSGTAPGLSALVAARAAQRMRESLKQQGWLERAKNDDPRTEAATLMLEAEMLIEARRHEEAVAVLKRLQETHGRHLAALRLELRARQGAGDWDGVLRVVRQLDKRDALPAELVREIKRQAHRGKLARFDGDARQLLDYFDPLPAAEKGPRLVADVVRLLMAREAWSDAQRLIERGLTADGEEWNDDLAALYGRLQGGDLTGRLARAEGWLPAHPDSAALLLTLGRLCLAQRLWGKAETYLEASLAVAPSREAHVELARLFEQLGREEEAARHYRACAALGLDQ